MLTIPANQLAVLDAESADSFESRVLDHLLQTLPEQMLVIGDEWAQRLRIRDGIRTAWGRGLSFEVDVVRFVDLTVLLGRDFDLDPHWQHVSDAMNGDGTPTQRLDAAFRVLIDAED